MTRVRVHWFGPDRPWFRPGSTISVAAELSARSASRIELAVELLDVDQVVGLIVRRLSIGRDPIRRRFRLELPDGPRHGYGLRLRVDGPRGRIVASSAVEALDGWW